MDFEPEDIIIDFSPVLEYIQMDLDSILTSKDTESA